MATIGENQLAFDFIEDFEINENPKSYIKKKIKTIKAEPGGDWLEYRRRYKNGRCDGFQTVDGVDFDYYLLKKHEHLIFEDRIFVKIPKNERV